MQPTFPYTDFSERIQIFWFQYTFANLNPSSAIQLEPREENKIKTREAGFQSDWMHVKYDWKCV